MDSEKKYKDLVKAVKELQEANPSDEVIQNWVNKNVPELAESQDERIRKLCEVLVKSCFINELCTKEELDNCVAWLEKQGEQKPITFNDAYIIDSALNDYCCKKYEALHKENGGVLSYARLQHLAMDIYGWCKKYLQYLQGEQEEPQVVEPKFKVGDWVVNNNSRGVYKITEIKDDEYCLWPLDGEIMGYLRIIDVDNDYHPWTIQDAKEGDVLVTPNQSIFIFKEIKGATVYDYCGLYFNKFCDEPLSVNGTIAKELPKNYVPTTREQRDLLFQKMKEAGYEWDADKKELKKIEQKPADKIESKFHKGDWVVCGGWTTQIKDVYKDGYSNIHQGFIPKMHEEEMRLWTIDDANDGDVLQLGKVTAIFKKFIGNGNCKCYCSVCDGEFEIPSQDDADNSYGCHNATPATKEQRDTLMKAMTEAGYEFDFKKKELKKIKQKFHEGDWITNGNETVQITGYDIDYGYQVDYKGNLQHRDTDIINNDYHLWTVDDVKDGDVLAVDNMIFIYKRTLASYIVSYCKLINDIFEPFDDARTCCEGNPYVHPTTKEQCDTLMKAIDEAGYEWDAENKQLRKIESRQEELTEFEKSVKQVMEEAIECGDTHNLKADADMLLRLVQKPTWSEEDERIRKSLIASLSRISANTRTDNTSINYSFFAEIDWLNSLKERVHPQPKQEWNKEDEYNLAFIQEALLGLDRDDSYREKCCKMTEWLDSIKDRYTWKPSEEHIEILNMILTNESMDDNVARILRELREQLQKLGEG